MLVAVGVLSLADGVHARSRRKRQASPNELMARAEGFYQRKAYGRAARLTKAVLAHPQTDLDTKRWAYWVQGCSFAEGGYPAQAEEPFKRLLQSDPDFKAPSDLPSEVAAVYRKVYAENRPRKASGSTPTTPKVLGDGPTQGAGGRPLAFSYRLKDPKRVVERLMLHFRREGESAYGTLELTSDPGRADAPWTGEIPGAWTENEAGFVLEYFVTTHDNRDSGLGGLGGPEKPLTLGVTPGYVVKRKAFYESEWFWTAALGLTVAAGAGGYVLYQRALELPEADAFVKVRP